MQTILSVTKIIDRYSYIKHDYIWYISQRIWKFLKKQHVLSFWSGLHVIDWRRKAPIYSSCSEIVDGELWKAVICVTKVFLLMFLGLVHYGIQNQNVIIKEIVMQIRN